MARYKALTPKELSDILKRIKKKNDDMIAAVRGSQLARIAMQGGFIVEARAKEIIIEKGHVVTGTLLRSINTQLTKVEAFSAHVEVGTFVIYGPFIENLDDGGYLLPASIETFPEVTRFWHQHGVVPVLEKWGAP